MLRRGLPGLAGQSFKQGGRVVDQHSRAFVGIDTSKLRNAVAVAEDGRGGDVRYLGEIDTTEAATRKLVTKAKRLARSEPRRVARVSRTLRGCGELAFRPLRAGRHPVLRGTGLQPAGPVSRNRRRSRISSRGCPRHVRGQLGQRSLRRAPESRLA